MATMHAINRRRFLGSLAAAPFLANYYQLTAAEKGKVKISDIKVMAVQGPRTYNLVKVETDAGIYGIGISAVGIAPAHLGRGAALALMERSMLELHDQGCPLSGLYPAWKAGRVVPVESIRLV